MRKESLIIASLLMVHGCTTYSLSRYVGPSDGGAHVEFSSIGGRFSSKISVSTGVKPCKSIQVAGYVKPEVEEDREFNKVLEESKKGLLGRSTPSSWHLKPRLAEKGVPLIIRLPTGNPIYVYSTYEEYYSNVSYGCKPISIGFTPIEGKKYFAKINNSEACKMHLYDENGSLITDVKYKICY